MLLFLAIISYSLVAVVTKSYYKLYRHTDTISPEDPYMIGMFWPIYIVYRLIAWPFISCSSYLEKKMIDIREKKEKANVRVCVSELTDSVYEEAEQEVESMLASSRERSLEL